MSVALADSVGGFFREAVSEAVQARKVEVTATATLYLVGLLTEFAHPAPIVEDTLGHPLALVLDEALRSTGTDRFQRLRVLGDVALYLTGFFGDHIENRGVDVGYVVSMGSTAYSNAGAMLNARMEVARRDTSEDNVFCELACKFTQMAEVLTTVAEVALAQQAHGEQGLVKLYERWLRSGSTTLAAELGARGVIPVRGPGTVQ